MLAKDIAICVRTADYSETSQIVTFFTQNNGKVGAIAKGSKRPKSAFGGLIEVFSYGEIVFAGAGDKGLATLIEFEPDCAGVGFAIAGEDLAGFNCACFGAELLDKLTGDYDPHPDLFTLFARFLREVGYTKERQAALLLLIRFQLGLLKHIGLFPVLKACVNCKKPMAGDLSEVYFSHSFNGMVCKDCEQGFPDRIKLSRAAANSLIDQGPTLQSSETVIAEVERLLIDHFCGLLGHRPRCADSVLAL